MSSTELVQLLARTAAGDTHAFRDFYDRTSAKLFAIILRILPERAEAEDVLQEVYMTIWRKAAHFDASRASPITWTATIARNRAIDRLRARAVRPATTSDAVGEASLANTLADEAPTADALIETAEAATTVEAALAQLDPRHAAAIRSCYLEGLTYEALAAREHIPVGTLKSWVRRGLLRMRAALEAANQTGRP
jgi:RNA polymerase sigma-70 factor (ECF subfamily)